MKVLLFTTEFPPYSGGAGVYTADLAEGLAGQGLEVTVLAPQYDLDYSEWEHRQNYIIIRSFRTKPRNFVNFKNSICLIKYMLKIKPDIIHSTNSGAHRIGAFVSFLLPLKPFITIHGSEIYKYFGNGNKKDNIIKSIIRYYIYNKYFHKAKGIICISNYTKELLLSKFTPKKDIIQVVYNGVCLNKFPKVNNNQSNHLREYYNIKKDTTVLISVSRLVEDKGNDMVISALNMVKNYYPNIKYIIVGDGHYKETLKNMSKDLNMNNNVVFPGLVDSYMLPIFYSISDIFILPSRSGKNGRVEGFGLVFVEAYCYGIPVIGTTHGGVPEVVIDGVTGYTVDPNDPDQIADAILDLISDNVKAKKMGEQGLKLVKEKFNSKRMSWETSQVYELSIKNTINASRKA